ncbi:MULTISPECIES: hypothetical protein [Cyanophyceae]|uniref:Uncharacterized protein n=1 Tax=Leptolyngbya subtilissima DQ-A4 TaxID=2933933 RepID=A0ABV0K369_9CYAN|nr:hypothetical protein [Nodosilinea sp. FACHB-141]MBD2113194.1 hypothetical protein [Nodosilinea sp. FACHB-141]
MLSISLWVLRAIAAIASFIRLLKQCYIPQQHFEVFWPLCQKTLITNKT